MEAHVAFGCLAVIAAFGGGTAAAMRVAQGARPRPADALVGGSALAGRAAWLARNGVGWAAPAARLLLRNGKARELAFEAVQLVESRATGLVGATEESVASVFVAASVLLGCAGGAVARSIVGGVAVSALFAAVVAARLHAAQDARREALREAVPDALRSMGTCFQSGLSLMQTLGQVASEANGPLRSLFGRAARRMEAGQGAQEALAALRQGSSVPELGFVVVALDVQHQSGGSIAHVLDAARETVEGELALKRSLRVQTAQAKLSARVVSVMPFALIALFSLVSEGFLDPFFSSAAGMALLATALGMQAAGIVLVRRMLAVEVD